MLKGNQPVIYGDGEQSRDFTYIQNTIEVNIRATEADCPAGIVMNSAVHQRITLNELVEKINAYLGTNIQPIYTDPRPGDVKHSFADISRMKEYLGYEPSVLFDEGLARTIEWYKAKYQEEAVSV
jgi:UDP-glucose 4-epimerase